MLLRKPQQEIPPPTHHLLPAWLLDYINPWVRVGKLGPKFDPAD
jgi:hypothetical protein